MLEILQYSFMQRALLAGMIIGVLCPLMGIFMVLRRMSLIGDSLSHVALSGVAAGLLLGVYPMGITLAFSVVAALAIEKLRKSYEQYAELAIAIILSGGIGVAVILISLVRSPGMNVLGFLFGSISTVLKTDLWLILGLGILIILFVTILYKELFYIAFDEESARIVGIPVRWINLLFIIMIAVTVTLSMRIVGVLLVSSLMVIPAATSLQIAKSFKQATFLSIVFAEISVVAGIFLSYYWEIAPGGTIVVLSILILIGAILWKAMSKKIFRKPMI